MKEAALGETTSLEELCDEIKGLMPDRPKVCIGIDGMDGVGKTSLARELAALLGATVISLDDHVERKRGEYVSWIRCQEVTAAMRATGGNVVIVDGVCLRAVAERCGFAVDVHVYVKLVSKDSGLWHDADICLAEAPVEDLKQHERELRRSGAVLSGRKPPFPSVGGPVLTQRSPLLRIFAQAFGARRPLQFFEPRPEPIGKSFLRQRAGAEFSPCVNQFGIRRCLLKPPELGRASGLGGKYR